MTKNFISLLTALVAINMVAALAQEGPTKPAEGTLTLGKKHFTLANAVAYESTNDGQEWTVVVLTAQPISGEKLKKALAAEKAGGFSEFPSPYIRLSFKKTGKLKYWSAAGGGTSVGGDTGGTGELQLQDGRVTGRAGEPVQADVLIPRGFDVKFNVALLQPAADAPVSTAKKGGPAANVKPTVTGVFKGNGKAANLAFVSARWSEPFAGKPGITLVFTEKDHAKANKPETDAMFGKFGNALIISLHEDGDIYGCQVVHSAHKHAGFSSSGSMETNGFTYADGKVEGELTTNGQVDIFDETWEVNLKFLTPLGEIPKEFQVAEEKKAETQEAPVKASASEPEKAEPSKPKVAGPKVKDLALTKDASDIEYKSLVEQMSFKSKSPVKSVCGELAKNLKAQGWTGDGSDLVNPNSSILSRKRGDATLTIFVKPESGGSEIKIMTKGLSWDGE